MRSTLAALGALAAGLWLGAAPAHADGYDLLGTNPLSVNPMQSSIPREMVSYAGPYGPGTILVSTSERRLYYVLPDHEAVRYGVGVGRPGFEWGGTKTISAKREWPSWTPPSQMIRRRPDLPRHMEGGLDNPLGAPRHVSRLVAVPHPRLERAGHDRPGRLVGLHPHDQRRRHGPLRARPGRDTRRRRALRQETVAPAFPGPAALPMFRVVAHSGPMLAELASPSITHAPLIDPFGRAITYVRVSVTDRCDFRCVYCMSEDMQFLPKRDLLTLEELDRLCSAFVALGTRKIRITGGEPLVRRDILQLFRGLSRHLDAGRLEEVTLTTNGSQLAQHAAALAACGVRRINVSLDTLDPDKFRAVTRRGDLGRVLDGIDAAQKAGLAIKINTVALRGVNDDEFVPLVAWAHDRGMDITFIEVMPLGEIDAHRLDQYMPLTRVRARLLDRFTLHDIPYATGGPARYVRAAETGGRIGFITPLTHNFCESCNRVRVTCTGTMFMCLGQEDAADLRAPLRESESDAPLHVAIERAIARKPKGHDFIIDREARAPAVSRHMSVTGG